MNVIVLGFVMVVFGWWNRRVWAAWVVCVLGVVLAEGMLFHELALLRMVGLVFVLLLGMKGIVHACGSERLTFVRYCAFALLWLGMRPLVFAVRSKLNGWRIFRDGVLCFAAGAVLYFVAQGNVWLGMVALSLMLHFGLMAMGAGGWRFMGIPANRLFRNPFKARTLREFWSRRWNLGYVEMIAVAVFRPVRDRFGKRAALVAAFVFSGLLHEVAISLPVHAGYGLPTLYFVIQAGLMGLEARFGMRSVVWVLVALILPVGILFHGAFLDEVIAPMLRSE
jgi:hypothetical protein